MKETLGQLGQVLSKEAIKRGFRIKGGRLAKYTKDGRKRNHWKSNYRHISKKYLKDKCENRRCNTIHNLTIHHKIPLSSAKSEKELRKLCEKWNCQTLCEKCHKELEHRITLMNNNKIKKVKKVSKVPKVKLIKSKILSSEGILMLEKGLWGEYRLKNYHSKITHRIKKPLHKQPHKSNQEDIAQHKLQPHQKRI